MFSLFNRIERDPIWRREVRERWRRSWTFLILGIYAAFLAILARVFYGSIVPQGPIPFSRQGLGLGATLFWRFVSWQILGWFPLGLTLGAPSLALERERQSLTEYALAGLESFQIVRAKWWSLTSFALVLVVAPLPIAALCFPLGGVSPLDFWSANILCMGVALASCSLGLMISAAHRTVSGAYLDTLKLIVCFGLPLGPPLYFFSSSLAPPMLIFTGVALVALPLYLLPKIEQEIFFVMRHLEVDAPQTPDYTPSATEVPLRLRPTMAQMGEQARQAHEPMSPQELAHYINAHEAERGSLDPPPSRLDTKLENVVARNPLARRDVRTQLRAWRRQLLIKEPPSVFSWPASVLGGGTLGLVGLADSKPGLSSLMYGLWHICLLPILLQIVLLSASSFTRERAGNMLVQLRLSALTSAEILSAKFLSPFLVGARLWGFPIVTLTLAAASYDVPRVALEAVLFVLLLLLVSLAGTMCSLLFRSVTLSTSATLFIIVTLLVVLPAVFSPLLFAPPTALQNWWLEPVRALLSGAGQIAIMAHLLLSLPILISASYGLCWRVWQKSAF